MSATCRYVYKQGKNAGDTCSTKKFYNNSKYCKQHYNRLFPENTPKIQEINSEGDPVNNETSSNASTSSKGSSNNSNSSPTSNERKRARSTISKGEDGVEVITIKSKREVMLDLDHILNNYKSTGKQITVSKTKSKSKPKPKIAEDTSDEYVEEGGISVPFREKSLYTHVLKTAANTCLFPIVELAVNKYTPLSMDGFTEEIVNSQEAQDAIEEVIEEMVPEAVEECSPTTKLLIILGAIGTKVVTTNLAKKADKLKEQESVLITEDLTEKYKNL